MRWTTAIFGLVLLLGPPGRAETVFLEAARDATLIEDPDGAWANGSGPFFFAGSTSQSETGARRTLLFFDVAAALPRDAVVESVSLRLRHLGNNTGASEVRLHRVQAPWGEGASSSTGGAGAPSGFGDATWIHAFHDSRLWVRGGGQFLGRASARLEVGGRGFYTWTSERHLAQDVRLWNTAPHRNFGWMLTGDETMPGTSKKFASRENPDASIRPRLEITYRLPGK